MVILAYFGNMHYLCNLNFCNKYMSGINSIFSIFLPKEDRFSPLIQSIGERAVMAAELFSQMISETDTGKQTELYTKIKSIETECDAIEVEIFDKLNESFVSPLDREDIHELCNELDDVVDLITGSAKRTILYHPVTIPNKAMHMAEIILEGTKALRIALNELKNISKKPQAALEQCKKVHDLEHEGDDVYDNFVKELFETEKDPIELIKIKEIMGEMEQATDKIHSIGKTLQTMIVKYA